MKNYVILNHLLQCLPKTLHSGLVWQLVVWSTAVTDYVEVDKMVCSCQQLVINRAQRIATTDFNFPTLDFDDSSIIDCIC